MLTNPVRETSSWDPGTRSGMTVAPGVILAIDCASVKITSDHHSAWHLAGGGPDTTLVEEAYLRREKRFGVKRLDWLAGAS